MHDVIFTLILGGLITAAATLWGLVCLWVALGRRPWYVRCGAATAVLALTVPLRAGDLLVVLAVQLAVVVLALRLQTAMIRRQAARRSAAAAEALDGKGASVHRFRFGLRDLLIAVTLIAAWFALAATVQPDTWEDGRALLRIGLGMAVGTWIGFDWLNAQGRWWWRLVSRVLILALAGILPASQNVFDWFPYFWIASLGPPTFFIVWPWLGIPMVVAILTGCLLQLGAAAGHSLSMIERNEAAHGESASRGIRWRIALVALLAVLILPLSLVYWRLLHPMETPVAEHSGPNGLEDILQAGKLAANAAFIDTDAATTRELSKHVDQHGNALRLIRDGLAKPCRREARQPDVNFDDLNHIRAAAYLLSAEAELARREGRHADALDASVAILHLARAFETEGIVLDWLVARAIEGLGMGSIMRISADTPPDELASLLDSIQSYEPGRQPLGDVLGRDRVWEENLGWNYALPLIVSDLVDRPGMLATYHFIEDRSRAINGLLAIHTALRIHQLRHGSVPASLDELVPGILGQLPIDPFSSEPFIYRTTKDGYVLYSVGPNGVDNGGRNMDWLAEDGDIDLASGLGQQPAPTPGEDEDTVVSDGGELPR